MSGLVRLKTVTDRQGVGTEMPTITDAVDWTRGKAWEKFLSDMADFANRLQDFYAAHQGEIDAMFTSTRLLPDNPATEARNPVTSRERPPGVVDTGCSQPIYETEGTPGPSRVATLPVNTEMLTTCTTSDLRSETPIAVTMTGRRGCMDDLREVDPGSSGDFYWKSSRTSLRSETPNIANASWCNIGSVLLERTNQDMEANPKAWDGNAWMGNSGCSGDVY